MLHWLNGWLAALRPIFETAYFLSAVALAVIAFKGLEQLKIAKNTAKISARREAFKLGADECRNFAAQVVPLVNALNADCLAQKLPSFVNPQFKIVNGEFAEHHFNLPQLQVDFNKCAHRIVAFLNALEAFSIFFASGIADEDVAYRETGQAFCVNVKKYMPAIYVLRSDGLGRFESTVTLYERWSARMEAEALVKTQKTIAEALPGLKKPPIKIIGDE